MWSDTRIVRAVLAYAATLMMFGAFLVLVFKTIDPSVRDVTMVLVGAIITQAKEVYGRFFGIEPPGTKPQPVTVENEPDSPLPVEEVRP